LHQLLADLVHRDADSAGDGMGGRGVQVLCASRWNGDTTPAELILGAREPSGEGAIRDGIRAAGTGWLAARRAHGLV